MSGDVLVVMDRGDASLETLEYVIREYPEATIAVTHVTEASDPLGLFGMVDPAEYMVPECGCESGGELVPPEDLFNRAQRRRAERVFDRACSFADSYGREIDLVVRSGDAVEEILTCAAERGVDRIVLPARCRLELRPFRRSVPEAVALRSDAPVTILG